LLGNQVQFIDGALVPGRAFGPCQYVAESARPGQPVHPTFYVLKIPCALLKILNFCGASLELHFTTATLALPRPNHMSLVCDGNQIHGYISDRLWSGKADNHGG